jgi:hypothetical protein
MLHSLGLLPHGNQNLDPYALRLFKSIRDYKGSAEANRSSNYWRLCNGFRWTFARRVGENDDQRRFPTHFLGLWDTVSSVGWAWDPARFPYTAANPSVKTARHAVSLDERRWFFRRNLLEPLEDQDVKERWFPGCHADLGGGYPARDGGLWRPPFEWMLQEARDAHLLVDDGRLARVLAKPPVCEHAWLEPQHESLQGIWWLAEFFPKLQRAQKARSRIPRLGLGKHRFLAEGDELHWSALRRIREKPDYAPPNLSSAFVDFVRSLDDVPEFLSHRQ